MALANSSIEEVEKCDGDIKCLAIGRHHPEMAFRNTATNYEVDDDDNDNDDEQQMWSQSVIFNFKCGMENNVDFHKNNESNLVSFEAQPGVCQHTSNWDHPTSFQSATNNNNNNNNNNIGDNVYNYEWLYCEATAVSDAIHQDQVPIQIANQKRHLLGESSGGVCKKQCIGSAKKQIKSKSSTAKDPQSIAAKNRRERISERLKILQELVPNGSKVDLVTMLEKAISYVKFLQVQVKILAADEFWPVEGGKAPDISQVKEAIDAILSSQRERSSSSNTEK